MTGALLLDSHLVYRWLYAPEQLPPRARVRVDGASGPVLVIDVTVWKVIVKRAPGAHHRDPFDRLLVAQATAEGVPLLTADRALGR